MNAGGVIVVELVQDVPIYFVVLDSGVVNPKNLNKHPKIVAIALKHQDVEVIYYVMVEFVVLLNGFNNIQTQ